MLRTFILFFLYVYAGTASAATMTDEKLFSLIFSDSRVNNTSELNKLLDENADQVKREFPKWLKNIPKEVLNNRERSNRYGNTIVAIIEHFNSKGDRSLSQISGASKPGNLLSTWGVTLYQAQKIVYSAPLKSIQLLEPYEREFKDSKGSGADKYMPKTLGVLGVAYFKIGNTSLAISYLERAKIYCELIGDKEGVQVYTDNLKQLKESASAQQKH